MPWRIQYNYMMMNSMQLWQEFGTRAAGFGSRAAIVSADGELSFADLFTAAGALADSLERAGVQPGSIVGLSIPNRVEFVVAYLALCRLSATVALISPKYHASELSPILQHLRPGFAVTLDGTPDYSLGRTSTVRQETCSLKEAGLSFHLSAMNTPAARVTTDATLPPPVLLKFTSGTTGEPKGIAWSAENVLAEAVNVVQTLGITPDDRIFAPVPLSHSYGFDLALLPMLYAGARLSLREHFIPRRMIEDVRRERISIFLGVPSMYRFLVETRFSSPPDLSQVRYVLSCTASLGPDLIEAFYQKFGAVICQHYGSSETGAATTHAPQEVLRRPASVGRAMKGVEISIVDDEGGRKQAGSTGEVVIAGPAVAQGYIPGGVDGPSPIRGGRYHTGDLGYLDEDGFLYLVGRKDRLINVGGYKVAPEEVVRVLESHPAVREAEVIGAHDPSGEEVVYAAVTLTAPAGENEILRHCRDRLAEYKVPRRVDIRREMPRLPSGKIGLRAEDITW